MEQLFAKNVGKLPNSVKKKNTENIFYNTNVTV